KKEEIKQTISANIENFDELERLYRANKDDFRSAIKELHEENATDTTAAIWYSRLFYKEQKEKPKNVDLLKDIGIMVLLAFIAWLPVHYYFGDYDYSFEQIIIYLFSVVFSLMVSLYFFLKKGFPIKALAVSAAFHICAFFYLCFLYLCFLYKKNDETQSFNNAFYFMFILFWFAAYLCYSGRNFKEKASLAAFVKICGELIVWYTIFFLGFLAVLFIICGLFEAIDLDWFSDFLGDNLLPYTCCILPYASIYFIEKTKYQFTAILANIFLPVFLAGLAIFAVMSLFSETKPYSDRDTFILFNVLLVFVICFLTYSSLGSTENRFINICSLALAVITVLLDLYTLSATIYRISSFGISAYKLTLLVTNIPMLGNLVFVLFRCFKEKSFKVPAKKIVVYLPAYAVLAFIVVFIFPFAFKFK
ncbi:MAG: hypothetical protein J6W46_11120, partial [Spirochaetaceae bacterium]|nr:hypothetical protein [Spirochaetaceae bacterium]